MPFRGFGGPRAGNHVLTDFANYRFNGEFVAGLGFLGIAVALLARNNPLVIPLTALVFGILVQAGTVVQTHPSWSALGVDSSITLAVQGLIVLFVGPCHASPACGQNALESLGPPDTRPETLPNPT